MAIASVKQVPVTLTYGVPAKVCTSGEGQLPGCPRACALPLFWLLGRIVHSDRDDFIRRDRQGDFVCGNRQSATLGLLHEIRLRRSSRPGGQSYFDRAGLPGPLVQMKDQAITVFRLLHGCQNNILRRHGDKRVAGWHGSGVRSDLHGIEAVVEFVTVTDRQCLLPVSRDADRARS